MATIGTVWREIQARLQAARDVAPSEGKQMAKAALGFDDNRLILQENAPFPAEALAQVEAMAARRFAGEPLAYILGFAWFYGRMWRVTPDVLIPRPDTEVLVEACLERIPVNNANNFRILEIGVGSGCIGGTLLAERPGAYYLGVEKSGRAAAVALENMREFLAGGGGTVAVGDMYAAVDDAHESSFNLIVSNPPYIADEEWENLDDEVKNFEPRMALTGDEANDDGLLFYRRLVEGAPARLASGGWLCMETGWQQARAVTELLQQKGDVWLEISIIPDLGGRERVVCARLH